MSALFASATLVAAGTPQSLATALLAAMPSSIIQGVTYAGGSATQRVCKLVLQADPANTGTNIYIGNRSMVKATRVGVGAVLAKGVLLSLDGFDGSFALEDIFFDGDTTGDKLLLSMVG